MFPNDNDSLCFLVALFCPRWTKDELNIVLTHCDSHLENAVDTILAHGEKRPQDLIDHLLDREVKDFHRTIDLPSVSRSSDYPNQARTELPRDFLRIPHLLPSNNTIPTPITAVDENLAYKIQYELFMEDTSDNAVFFNLSERSETEHLRRQGDACVSNTNACSSFRQALSELSSSAKRTFSVLTQKFNSILVQPDGSSKVDYSPRERDLDALKEQLHHLQHELVSTKEQVLNLESMLASQEERTYHKERDDKCKLPETKSMSLDKPLDDSTGLLHDKENISREEKREERAAAAERRTEMRQGMKRKRKKSDNNGYESKAPKTMRWTL